MGHPRYSSQHIAARGQALYDDHVRELVEPSHVGKYVAIDIDSGAFEVDSDRVAAIDRVKARDPDAAVYLLRIGHPAVVRVGGPFAVQRT